MVQIIAVIFAVALDGPEIPIMALIQQMIAA